MKKIARWLKKYFIPHLENDQKPHLLRRETVTFVILIVLVAEAAFLFGSSYVAPRSKLFGLILVNALVDGTNQNRVANNLPPLKENSLLDAAAQQKANDMVANNYFAHESPTGVTPWHWFDAVGYKYIFAGENLAANFVNSEDVVTGWMNSPGHRANILDTRFTEIGMATAQGTYQGFPTTYVVEVFGTPSPSPIAFVNTAAASAENPAPQSAPVPATATAPAPAPKPVAAVKPKPALHPQPASTTEPGRTFVAVNSASTTPLAVAPVETSTIPATSTGASTDNTPAAASVSMNPISDLFANPKKLADYFYIAVGIIFLVGLLLNIFIKIRIQHPKLILGGLLVIVVAGTFILLNQNILSFNAAIL